MHTSHPDQVAFVTIGDPGKSSTAAEQVAASARQVCEEQGCDLVFLLGDLIYPRGMTSPSDPHFDDYINDRYRWPDIPLVLALGNHEYAHGRNIERASWLVAMANRRPGILMPSNHFTLDAGPATFAVLDTNHAFQWGEEPQLRRMKTALEQATTSAKVVIGHHPLFSNGKHGNAGQYEGWSSIPWVSGNAVERLLRGLTCDGPAAMGFSGHEHNLQYHPAKAACDATWVVSGAGASVTPIVDRGNHTAFEQATPGFFRVVIHSDPAGRNPPQGHVQAFDQNGTLLFSVTEDLPVKEQQKHQE